MGHVLSGFMMELMMTSSKRAYVTGCVRPRSAVPKVPALQQVTADPYLLRRHSNTQRQVWLSLCGVSWSWCTPGFVWALWESLVDMGFDLNVIFHLPTISLGVCVGGGVVRSNILLPMVIQQWVAVLEFFQVKMNTCPSLCHLASILLPRTKHSSWIAETL